MQLQRGNEIQEFDAKLGSRIRKLGEVVKVQLPLLKAHVFLKKLEFPPEKEPKIITGALQGTSGVGDHLHPQRQDGPGGGHVGSATGARRMAVLQWQAQPCLEDF